MVHLKIFELNVSASQTTTRSLPQNWRISWLRLLSEKNIQIELIEKLWNWNVPSKKRRTELL